MCGRAAAFSLLTGLCFVTFTGATALAESPHVSAAVDTDSCAACHTAHADPTLGDKDTSCIDCHNGSDPSSSNVVSGTIDSFGMPSGHSLTPSGAGTAQIEGCDTCHAPHGASSVSRGIPAKEINGAQVSSAGKQLCLACHSANSDWYGPGYPSTTSPIRDDEGYPIAGTWPGPDVYSSPSNPHRLIPEATQTVGISDPVRREQGDCLYCHGAHGGANDHDDLVANYSVPSTGTLTADKTHGTYAALCFTCHGGTKPSGFATAPVDIKQFVTDDGDFAGHTIETSGGTLPVGSPLPCFECHAPMGSARGNDSLLSDERGAGLETNDAAGVRAFCFTCHITSDTTAGWDSATATYTPVSDADKIVGLPRTGGDLHLSDVPGHSQDDAQSCYDCHGDSYASGGHNVHNPDVTGAQVAALPQVEEMMASDDTSLSVDATPSIEPSGSLTPSGAVDATGSADASGSADATGSADASGTTATDSTDATGGAGAGDDVTGGTAATGGDTTADTVPPVTVSDALATYAGTATITLSASDGSGGSGVVATYYRLDAGDVTTGTVVNSSALGLHTLQFWSADAAGNVEAPTTVTFTITDPLVSAAQPALNAGNDLLLESVSA